MKKLMKSLCIVMALVIMCTACLTSCGSGKNVIYLKGESGKILSSMNENMFSFHLSLNKTSYLYGFGLSTDSAELWQRQASDDGRTVGDFAFDAIVENAKKYVACAYIYDGTKNSSEEMKSQFSEYDIQIEKQIDEIVNQGISVKGSKSAYEEYLSGFGIDTKNLREYYTLYLKMSTILNMVEVTEQEKEDYFEDNYAIVKHILVNTSFRVAEDGSKVALTEGEVAEKLVLAENIQLRLDAGESFEELWEEYKEADAAGAEMYPEGYFVCKNSNFTLEFEEAALDMKEGEIRPVESSYGIHIMKKYPMDSSKYNLYEDIDSAIDSAIANEKFTELVAPYVQNMNVDSEILSNYTVAGAPILN